MAIDGLLKAETRGQAGATNVWLTPRYILDALGPFDLDPAGCREWTTASRHFYEEDNGLYQDWSGLIWLNPPYGNQTADWVERWAKHPDGFLLVAARPDTGWFHEAAKSSDLALFPRRRIPFFKLGCEDNPMSPAFASVIFARGQVASARLRKLMGIHWVLAPLKEALQ